MRQVLPYEMIGDFVSTPFDVCEFIRRFRRGLVTWEPQSAGLTNHVFNVRNSNAVPQERDVVMGS